MGSFSIEEVAIYFYFLGRLNEGSRCVLIESYLRFYLCIIDPSLKKWVIDLKELKQTRYRESARKSLRKHLTTPTTTSHAH
jgi:hypothetical protein